LLDAITIGGQQGSGTGGGPIQYDIFRVDGMRALLPSLFSVTLPAVLYTDVKTLTPRILLDPNTVYILAMTFPKGGSAVDSPDYFAGGQIFGIDGNDGSGWILDRGPDNLFDSYDWQDFSVTLSTPEPGTATLVGIGLVGLAGSFRRRTRSRDS
jgi:hypothetical protein